MDGSDVTIPDGEGQPFVGVILILPDGRSADELDIGRLMSEKQEYVKQDLDNLDKARRKAEAALLAVANGGGDARLRHLFKNPTQTIAKLQNQRTALAALKQELVFGPIKRTILTAALDTAAGWERPEKEPKEPATLLAEKKKEKLAVKGAGLREGGKKVEDVLIDMGLEDAVLVQIKKRLEAAVSSYNVADSGGQLDVESSLKGALQSRVIEAAKLLIPKVIESARVAENGVRYLRDRIDETATILLNVGEQMMIAAREMGQDMFELTGESLRAYLERDKNGYFNLINALKIDALKKAESRNGVDVSDDAALAKYHLSLSTNADSDEHRIFEHSPGDGRHAGKLVLIFLGNFQHLGDEEAGLYKFAREQAKREGYEVLTFRVGDLYQQNINEVAALDSFQLHPNVVLSHTKTIIEDRMQKRGLFAEAQQITIVGSEHYSRGGGTGDKLFGNEDSVRELLGGAILKATAYIDAVSLDSGVSIARRPAAEHFFNAHQEHTHSYIDIMPGITPGLPPALPYFDFGQGQPVRGQNIVGAENELQNYGTNFTHLTIDDNLARLMIDKVLSSL